MNPQLLLLIIAVVAAVVFFLLLKMNKKNISKESNRLGDVDEENAKITANEMINVKDIRNGCLHTNDGWIFTFIEIPGVCMDLYSASEKLDYCHKLSAAVARFRFPYKYFAISSPYSIKHKVTADTEYLKNASGLCRSMLEDDINFVTRLVIDENKIDRRFFIALYSKSEDEKVILDRVETVIKGFKEANVICEKLADNEVIRMYNLFSNPAYTAYERTDDVYLALSRIIAQNNM